MKISELSRRTGVPKETIHYYVREGVLKKPRKIARNIAEYDETYIEKIRMVKELQDEHFLPLSVIKKILKRNTRSASHLDHSSFQLLKEYFRPVDRLFPREVVGREAFREATGIGEKWLARMEEWGVIAFRMEHDQPVYSHDDVAIGKLVVEMDRLGYGPKDGHDPEDLRFVADFVRWYVKDTLRKYRHCNRGKIPPAEGSEKGSRFIEVMSIFFYHLYRRFVREEYCRLLEAAEKGIAESEEEIPEAPPIALKNLKERR